MCRQIIFFKKKVKGAAAEVFDAMGMPEKVISREDLTEILLTNKASDAYGVMDEVAIYESLRYSDEWIKKEIPLDKFPDWAADPKIKSKFPVVTLGEGGGWEVIDGKHRIGSAKERGEKTIVAYIPVEEDISEMLGALELAEATILRLARTDSANGTLDVIRAAIDRGGVR